MYDFNGWTLGVIALIAVLICGIEAIALNFGVNGNALTTTIASLSGLGGFLIRSLMVRKKGKR